MVDFFKSTKFRILAALFAVMFGFMVRSARDGTTASLFTKVTSIVLEPFSKATASLTHGSGEFFGSFLNARELHAENAKLKEEISELTNQMVDFQRYKNENAQLKEFLEIKERNQDFDFEPAMVIGRDTGDRFYSFTIDKGSLDGISSGDPVICSWGLVGVVSEVSTTSAKVLTILDATVEVGVMDASTREIGIVSGTVALSLEGRTKFSFLPRDSAASVGDIVVTSGVGGVFPKELVLGRISAIAPESHGLSIYAEVTPLEDIRTVTDVLIITGFEGQAGGDAQ